MLGVLGGIKEMATILQTTNGWNFAGNILNCIFMEENYSIFIQIYSTYLSNFFASSQVIYLRNVCCGYFGEKLIDMKCVSRI